MAETSAQSTGDTEALAKRVKVLNQKMDDAKGAAGKAKAVSLAMTLVIIVAAVIGVTILLLPVKDAYENRDQYLVALKGRLEDSIVPNLKSEFQNGSVQETAKEVGRLVKEKIQSRQEEVKSVILAESEGFVTDMRAWGEATLTERRDLIKDYMDTKIRNEVPAFNDAAKSELILANGQEALDAAVNIIIDKYLGDHLTHFFNIENQLNSYPVPEEIANMDNIELMDELTNSLGLYAMDIIRISINPNTREFLREVAKDE